MRKSWPWDYLLTSKVRQKADRAATGVEQTLTVSLMIGQDLNFQGECPGTHSTEAQREMKGQIRANVHMFDLVFIGLGIIRYSSRECCEFSL